MTQPPPYQSPGFPPPGGGVTPDTNAKGGRPPYPPRDPFSTPTEMTAATRIAQPYGPSTNGQQPYGQQPYGQPQPSIDDFAPPRPKTSLVVAIVAAAVALVVILFVVTRPPSTTPATQPSAQPSTSWGLPFTSSDGGETGQWQITGYRWQADGLHATIRVAVQRGPLQVVFMAFLNDSSQAVEPLPSDDFPLGYGGAMESGDDRTGTVVFPMSRADATVILGDYWGNQISALPVAG